MTSILLVGGSALVSELFAAAIRERLGYSVDTFDRPRQVTDAFIDAHQIDVALVDLTLGSDSETGIDALLKLYLRRPSTKLIVMTNGDERVDDLIRDAWEAFPLASVISTCSPVQCQLDTIARVVRNGQAPPTPFVHLPATKSPWRTLAGFERLVQHRGHAKLWATVLACGPDANYQHLSAHSGLRQNALRNYRSQLLPELMLHGMKDPRMRDLYQFARRSRPFLAPYVNAKGIEFDE